MISVEHLVSDLDLLIASEYPRLIIAGGLPTRQPFILSLVVGSAYDYFGMMTEYCKERTLFFGKYFFPPVPSALT